MLVANSCISRNKGTRCSSSYRTTNNPSPRPAGCMVSLRLQQSHCLEIRKGTGNRLLIEFPPPRIPRKDRESDSRASVNHRPNSKPQLARPKAYELHTSHDHRPTFRFQRSSRSYFHDGRQGSDLTADSCGFCQTSQPPNQFVYAVYTNDIHK